MAACNTTKNSASGRILKGAVGALLLLALLAPIGSATGFRESSSAASGATTVSSLDLTPPATTQQYDVMLAGIATRGACADVGTPAGWTKLRCDAVTGATAIAQTMYWKAASASESSPYTWTFATPVAAAGGISSYSGVDSATPFDGNNTGYIGQANTLPGVTVTAPALTTSQANQRVVGFFGIATQTTFAPTAMTERFDVKSALALPASGLTLEGTDFTQVTSGSTTNPRTSAAGLAAVSVGQLVALKAPTVSFGAGETGTSSAAESATPAIAVTLSAPSSADATVDFALASSGTNATTPADYSPSSGSVFIPAGTMSVNLPVTLVDDLNDEPDQTVKFQLANPANAVFPTPASPPQHTLTITDNDAAPTVEFNTAASSGSEGASPASIPVRLSLASGFNVTVGYSTSGGSATAGSDYTAISTTTLTFAPGETSKTINVTIIDESSGAAVDEPSETFLVTLSGPNHATLGTNGTHTRTITDNDVPKVNVTAEDDSATEGGDTGRFMFTRTTGDVSVPLTIDYAVTTGNGQATAGTDYTALPGSVTIAIGQASANVTVTTIDDGADEGSETVVVNLVAGAGYIVGTPATATVTILDDDIPTIGVAATDSNATEAGLNIPPGTAPANTGQFTVTRTGPVGQAITVSYTTNPAGDTTTYTALSGTVAFNATETTKTITVSPVDDPIPEAVLPVDLTLTGAGPIYAINPLAATATVYVNSNDGPLISITGGSRTEGDSATPGAADHVTFTVSVSPPASIASPVSVRYHTVDVTATAGSDYVADSDTLTFTSGTPQTIEVDVIGDVIEEPAQTFRVELFHPSNGTFNLTAVVPSLNATGTITDNDGPPTLAFASDASTGAESETPVLLPVTLSAPRPYDVRVNYTVTGGTGTAGSDFTLAAGTLLFAPGETSKSVSLAVADDGADEPAETVVITLSNAVNGNGTVSGFTAHTYTITDNDQPLLSFRYAASTFGENDGSVKVEVVVSPASYQAVTVDYTAFDGSANNGTDFTLAPGTLTFAAGDGSENITVPLTNDSVDELTENFDLVLSDVSAAASFGDNTTSTVTIVDKDDPDFTVTAPASVPEQGPAASFTVTRVGATTRAITVPYTVGGTATAGGADYPTLSGSVAFASGQSTATVSVLPTDDAADEAHETIILTLVDGAAYNLTAPSSATMSITDNDDPSFTVAATDGAAAEAGLDTGTFTVTRSGTFDVAVDVTLAVGGTATSSSDFAALGATVHFEASDTTKTVTVTPVDDASDEPAETVTLTLATGTGYVVGSPATASVTIADDDLPTVTVAAADDASEASLETGNFTVTRTAGDLTAALVVSVASTGTATGGSDYTALAATVTIPIGQTAASVLVTPLQDTTDEPSETILLTVQPDAAYTVGSPSAATVNLADDDGEPEVGFNQTASSIGESDGTLEIEVGLSAPSGKPVTVEYFAGGGTATIGGFGDFLLPPGTLTFAPGEVGKTITVTITDDALNETTETREVLIGLDVDNATLGTATHTFSIVDDDDAPEVAFSGTSSSGAESTTPADLNVSLSAASGQPVTVHYAITGGSATSADRTLAAGDLAFAPGETWKHIALAITGDAIDEDAETVIVTLSAPANATLGATVAHTYTIQDDDGAPTVAFHQAAASTPEDTAPGNLNLTVRLSGPSAKTVTVVLGITGGSATPTDDFTVTVGTLTFAPGDDIKSIQLDVVADALDESDETAEFTLSSPTNATVGSIPVHTLTIVDDDASPTVAWRTASSDAAEDSTTVVWADLSAASGRTVTVAYAVAAGTAGAGDFTAASGTLTFAAGNTSQPISVVSAADSLDEANETVVATLSSPANATLGAQATHTHTILDDDTAPTVAFSATASSGAESATPALLNVSLSAASGKTVTVDYAIVGGTAGAGDRTLAAGTLTFDPGVTAQSVSLAIVSDSLDEADETVPVVLSGAVNAVLGANATHTYTIEDDDGTPTVSFGETSSTGAEATTPVTFGVTLAGPTDRTVSVAYAVTGGSATAGTDFVLAAGTLTFAPGVTTRTISAAITNDAADEANETFTVTLSGPVNATLGANTTHTHTIVDDDTASSTVSLRASDTSASETGPATGAFMVTRTGNAAIPITVQYTVGGTATPGDDYATLSGSIDLGAGITSATFVVTPVNDALNEGPQTVVATVVAAHGYFLGTAKTGTVTIADNDPLPKVSFAAATGSADEGAGTLTVNVTLSEVSGRTVTVKYTTAALTAKSPADYTASTGALLTFAPGETSKTVTIPLADDSLDEANETFRITLGTPVNVALGTVRTFTGTIVDDDDPPTVGFQLEDSTAAETGSRIITISLSEASGKTVTVHFATSNVDAVAGSDYTALAGTLSFLPGTLSKTISVAIRADALPEADETFVVTLDSPANAVLGTDVHTVTIVDND